MRELARAGKAIVMISSQLSEMLSACDRIVVLSDGRVTDDIARVDLDDAGATGEALPAVRWCSPGRPRRNFRSSFYRL